MIRGEIRLYHMFKIPPRKLHILFLVLCTPNPEPNLRKRRFESTGNTGLRKHKDRKSVV